MPYRLLLKPTLLSTILLFISLTSHADTAYLNDGDIISGKILSFADGILVFSTKYDVNIKIHRSNLKAMRTDSKYAISFENGDQASGTLSTSESNETIIKSDRFGYVKISPSDIIGLKREFDKNNATPISTAPGNTSGAKETDKQYGEEKKKSPPLNFLIGSTVLLAPGQYELDFGAGYKTQRTSYSLQQTGYFERSAYTARQTQFDATLRGGIADGLEAYITLPYTYTHIEDVSTNASVRNTSEFRLGDIGFGLQYLLIKEVLNAPAVSLTLDVSTPTGKKEYRDFTENWKDPLDNGSGHWSVTPGLAFVRTTDPAILFGGVGYRHSFERTINGYEIKPGRGLASYVGVGFALNEKLSIGSRLAYAYNSRMTAQGTKIYGSDTDPLDLSFSASYNLSENWVVTPRITYSVNADAGTGAIQINIKRRFQ